MRRSTRLILTVAAIAVSIGLLGWAASSLDLVGMIAKAHAPPQHGG